MKIELVVGLFQELPSLGVQRRGGVERRSEIKRWGDWVPLEVLGLWILL